MNVRISPSKARGIIEAPPSKSMAHRALICAALSDKSVVKNIALSQDIKATLYCLEALGANIEKSENRIKIGSLNPLKVEENVEICCNESGSTLRFMLPLCMLSGEKIKLTGSKRLFERPLSVYEDICKKQGILFEKNEDSVTVCGTLKSGDYSVRGDISSQFISGLLFALPLLKGNSTLTVTGKFESAAYVDLTISALKAFGIKIKRKDKTFYINGSQKYRNHTYSVEGDYSNAAFLDAFNLLGGKVKVSGLKKNSLQGDKVYKDIYRALKSGEKEFDLSDCPDLAPILFTLAAVFGGCKFTGTARLKIKESDRAAAVCKELSKFCVDSEIFENEVIIKESKISTPTEKICAHNDHRIVMSMAVLLSKFGGEIEAVEAVNKSYPDFFETIKKLKVGLEIYED